MINCIWKHDMQSTSEKNTFYMEKHRKINTMIARTTNGCRYSSHVVTVDIVPSRANPPGGANMLQQFGKTGTCSSSLKVLCIHGISMGFLVAGMVLWAFLCWTCVATGLKTTREGRSSLELVSIPGDTVDGSEILHDLTCIKPCKSWDKILINWCRISEPWTVSWFHIIFSPNYPLSFQQRCL